MEEKKWQRIKYMPCTPLGEDGRIVTGCKEHIELSRKAACEGMVLIKNDDEVLPFKKGTKLAVFGKAQADYVKGGGGSGDTTVAYVRSVLEGLQIKEEEGKVELYAPLGEFYSEYVKKQYEAGEKPGFNGEPELSDELIKGAADCLKRTLGNYGKVYRTGGDEFVAIFFADEEHLEYIISDLDSVMMEWSGQLVSSLSLSVGYVTKRGLENETIINIAKLADDRMYKAKADYYSRKGIDRRGQAAAHKALCDLYTKILKINLTEDTYSIVNMDISEQTREKGFTDTISGWLSGFGKSGQVHSDDLSMYLEKTDVNYLKEYFKSGKSSISIMYRRKYDDGFKQVAMEMIKADDYKESNQTLFLYVKNIDI